MEETVTRNRELFYRIAELIEANPELYNQRSWGRSTPCGTAQCIAGHAAALAGWEPLRYHVGSDVDWSRLYPRGSSQSGKEAFEWRHVDSVGRRELGLTYSEAWILFASGWHPKKPYKTVPEALRAFGDGARIA